MDKLKKHDRFRLIFQLAAAALFNGYAAGFTKGIIFTGKTKYACVPVLNCGSCPGALGSCPIGSLQAVERGSRHAVSFYCLGMLMLFGTLFGRFICGFLCPFGLIQDLLHKIPVKKLSLPKKADKLLRYAKYVILVVFVIFIPIFVKNEFGSGEPTFCKFICPAGTLEAGIPLTMMNSSLRSLIGPLFTWKMLVLIAVVVGSIFISRFFCRYLCPLGAFYGLFNRFALCQMHLDRSKCINCKKCETVCPMDVEVTADINTTECIRCGRCKAACPTNAIDAGFSFGSSPAKQERSQ